MKIVNEIMKDIKNLFRIRNKKTFIKQNVLYLVFFYLENIFASHVNSYTGGDVLDRIFQATLQLNEMSFIPSFDIINISIGLIFAVVIKLIVYSICSLYQYYVGVVFKGYQQESQNRH